MGYEFSSTQANLTGETAQAMIDFGKKIPQVDLAADGREAEPHVTLKYGIHDASPEAARKLLENERPVKIKLGKVSTFPPNKEEGFEVVKVDIDSPDLHRLNKKLTSKLEHTDTHPDYHPHATIAYVKIGRGEKYIGSSLLEGKEVVANKIVFSSKNGTKTEIKLRQPGRKYYGE
jgi:2'-5' RNA ligase